MAAHDDLLGSNAKIFGHIISFFNMDERHLAADSLFSKRLTLANAASILKILFNYPVNNGFAIVY
ncbi:hypothetical protein [Desulfosarcina variabilis]|uniref:hypothetical protein n=1 Tax=Desulfosarcina variabilis TaxID=2300 RepID=UPI003AFB1D0F